MMDLIFCPYSSLFCLEFSFIMSGHAWDGHDGRMTDGNTSDDSLIHLALLHTGMRIEFRCLGICYAWK